MKKLIVSIATLTFTIISYGQSTQCKRVDIYIQCENYTTKSKLCQLHNLNYTKENKNMTNEEKADLMLSRSKEFYAEVLEKNMCKKTLSTIKECEEWIRHLLETDEYKHNNESLTNLLTELTRIPLTKNHPLNKYK